MEMTGHGKHGKPKSRLSTLPTPPWKSLQDFAHSHGFDDGYYEVEDRQSPPKTRNQSHSHRKGLVNPVPGLKRKGCPGTLRMLLEIARPVALGVCLVSLLVVFHAAFLGQESELAAR